MTFAEADRALTQQRLPLERPRPEKLFRPGSQNDKLYRRLLEGPVTNSEIIEKLKIYNSTGRASDIRKKLRPYLLDIKTEYDPSDRSRVVYKLTG